MRGWTTRDSLDLYNVDLWSSEFFSVNDAGNAVVRPRRQAGPEIDLKELIEQMRARGYALPLLFRFLDILSARVRELAQCFRKACQEYDYDGPYRGVYPINSGTLHLAELPKFSPSAANIASRLIRNVSF